MSNISNNMWDELTESINDSKKILLSTHVNPDGDGLGSEIAFYYYLIELGKKCKIINASEKPYNYDIIDPDCIIQTYNSSLNDWLENVDLVVVFDIGDFKRTGEIGDLVKDKSKLVCIDHHPPKHDHPFDLNIIDVEAPATGYMVWKYFQYIKYKLGKLPLKIANGLYASVVTDTGSFKYQSTTSDTHLMAADLLNCKVDGYAIQRSIYEQQRIPQIKLLGTVISNLKFLNEGKVVYVIITKEMMDKVGATDDDAGGFTEYLRMIENVEVSYMIRVKDGHHRINFRSSGNLIINDIAMNFGGGGHKFAAGAKIEDMHTGDIVSKINFMLNEKIMEKFNVN